MFFKEYFISIVDCLNSKFEGIQRKGQNPVDKGELCEIFIKNFLCDFLSDQLKIFRGGKIINIDNLESKQIDIIITPKNTIKIFEDKGIYPIETVFGVFSITSTLDHPKFLDSIKEIKSIPKKNPQFWFHPLFQKDPTKLLAEWERLFPYKCIFGFTGDINQNWENYLNNLVKDNSNIKNFLPDIVIVNKKGMLQKIYPNNKFSDGTQINKDFHYTDFSLYTNYGCIIIHIIKMLYNLSNWQYTITPYYEMYFNKDL